LGESIVWADNIVALGALKMSRERGESDFQWEVIPYLSIKKTMNEAVTPKRTKGKKERI